MQKVLSTSEFFSKNSFTRNPLSLRRCHCYSNSGSSFMLLDRSQQDGCMCRIIQRRNRNNVLLSSTHNLGICRTHNLCICLLKFSAFVETEAKALWVVGGRQKNRLKNFSALSKPAARNCFSPLSHFSLISLFWQNWKTDSMASVLLSICL